jgi:mono/diheme cytochrome c family protein
VVIPENKWDRGAVLKKTWGIALFILLLAVMSACNNEDPADEQATAPVTEQEEESVPATEPAKEAETSTPAKETAVAGDEVFQKSCITCHSSGDIVGGQAKIDGAKIHTDFQKQEDLLAFVSEKMPKSAPGSLSDQEYEAVVQFLWDQK